ncbi:Secologanin synthase [Rhynchospora pubera]|uniref:Secologanin synthase n=1 Tax=Rhynchospora pubera TaxID=906938 RepID=A0AAV8CWY7_9POAL|nr:Secologanin synthase [Rhynchospora pubera]
MHRHLRDGQSLSHSPSSSVGSQTTRSESLPLIPCPDCGVTVKKFVSRTKLNPNRDFYKCINKYTRCDFWKWDTDYERYVTKASNNIPSLDSELLGTLQAQMDNLTNEFKRKCESDEQQMKALVASLLKMKVYNCIGIIVIVTLLIMVIALLINLK